MPLNYHLFLKIGVMIENFHASEDFPLFCILENINERGELSSKDNALSNALGILSDDPY